MRQILASFSQDTKSSSKQWVQILDVIKKQNISSIELKFKVEEKKHL